ncbi:MAG: FIST C-terminal domain-containing protein [Alphaproteobacteria bacterium]|nr:FIST C-terminal domain-containing protein [Alphaproteobacteria bacterium]
MFAAAHAGGSGDWAELADRCLAELGDVRGATVGFVYATDVFAQDFDAIVAHLRSATGVEAWAGTVAIGVVGGAREYFDEPALAVMTAAIPAGTFRLLPAADGDALAPELVRWARDAGPTITVAHGDGRDRRLPDRLGDLADLADSFVLGGLGSSRVALPLAAGAVGRGPLAGVVFTRDVLPAVGITQGCTPLTEGRRRITKAEGNVVHTLDDMPALEALQADLATLPEEVRIRASRRLHVALPIVGSDRADYLVRNLIGIDPQRGSIAIGEEAEPGRALMFVRRDEAAAAQDLTRMARDARRRLGARPRAALYFTCLARGPNLFGPGSAELAALRAEIGEVPLAGMFCDGEISNARLYGYTGVLALFA